MADLRNQDRLQPALLDRLQDDGPRSQAWRNMSVHQLREAVMRDLTWLFNSTSLDSIQNLDAYPQVVNSVVNFGMPDLSGCVTGDVDISEYAKRIRQAILDFEPRLTRKSVRVRPEARADGERSNSLAFEIEAELWAEPVPIHLYLRTRLDMESGEVEVRESGGAD